MKKTLTLLVLLIIFALALGSCDNSENPTDSSASGNDNNLIDNIFSSSVSNYGSISDEEAEARKEYSFRLSNLHNISAYNNCLFFHTKTASGSINGSSGGKDENIMFYDTTYKTDTPMSAFFESIGSLPFDVDRMFINCFIVDEYASEKIGGLPVFLISIDAYNGDENLSGIYSYNMNSRELKLCHPTQNEHPSWIGLYGDRLYYSYDNGDKGYLLCSVKLDGTDKKVIEKELKFQPFIVDVNDEYIFYAPGSGGTIYRCDSNFENITKFARTVAFQGGIYNGYLYYADEKITTEDYNDKKVSHRGLARKPIDATIDDPEEIILEKSAMEVYGDGVIYIREKEFGRVYNISSRILALDPDTLETTVAFEYTQNDEDLIMLQDVYGDEWVVHVTKYEDGTSIGSTYAYYNSKSGVWQEFDLS